MFYRPRPKSAYQRKMSVCVSHHILIWVHMFWHFTYVLTRCHVTDINHVLTPCHVTEINYVDRGVAARTPLQYFDLKILYVWTGVPMKNNNHARWLSKFACLLFMAHNKHISKGRAGNVAEPTWNRAQSWLYLPHCPRQKFTSRPLQGWLIRRKFVHRSLFDEREVDC